MPIGEHVLYGVWLALAVGTLLAMALFSATPTLGATNTRHGATDRAPVIE